MQLSTGKSCPPRARGRVGPAARVVRQVLAAVAHLHARGVAHRDVKPENILFASPAADAPVKLVDFGLARRLLEGSGFAMGALGGRPGCGLAPSS